ncbi:MAG TPA: hypothetical protein PLN54_13340 [Flavobacteriales bacterium]|nr:hypothetical protein [Flavobacteriales bacterium]
MSTERILLASTLSVALLVGCKKEDGEDSAPSVPGTPTANTLLALFDQHVEDATQLFTLNAASGGSIVGQDGVSMFFPPNAFRTQTGSVVTGTVQVELVEVLTVGDMLWLNKRTVGNDNGQLRPLVSGGQYYLNVTQNGQALRLAENAGTVNVPALNGWDPNMQLFSGTVDANGIITWDPFAYSGIFDQDTLGYSFPNDSLGWVNCDYFMSQTPLTGVQVVCPSGHNGSNTLVWLIFPDQNSLTGLVSAGSGVFSTGTYYQLPVGLNVQVVALSNRGGAYSWSTVSTTVTDGMSVDLTFAPTSLQEFQQFAEGL